MLIALPNAFGDAATNMAIDAALLESMPEGLAAFRHYGWTEPAATFGYSQRYKDVKNTVEGGITLCRRLTGGGIVDHRNDWTYALILNNKLAVASLAATEIYEHIHRAIGHTLAAQRIENSLAPCPRNCDFKPTKGDSPDQCFTSPAANDVLRSDGQKIAGAAMKRNRSGLLIQGSIHRGAVPESFDYGAFQNELVAELASRMKISQGELEDIRPLFKSEIIKKEKVRLASKEWTQKR